MAEKIGVPGQAFSFGEVIENARKEHEANKKKLEENGGKCLHCGEHDAEGGVALNPFHCVDCNAETQGLIDQLSGSPGFMQIKVPVNDGSD